MIDENQMGIDKIVQLPKPYFDEVGSLDLLDREDLLSMVKKMVSGGVVLSFHGKRTAQEIDKRVRPRCTRIIKQLCFGLPEEQTQNMIIEGENLQAMVTLYKYRGQVDLIITDPPYNTGQHFRYNDRWDTDPNDPDLGTLVSLEDGSRHTKWMKAMMPRLNLMKAMLKPGGVIAICIDENELFHLGMMMDEVFKEENRIAIVNWQKSYSPKNDTGGQRGGVSSATEYVLVYAKDLEKARTQLLQRTGAMDSRYKNPDNDPNNDWKSGDASAPGAVTHPGMVYAIQSPFTGKIYYPPEARCWGFEKKQIKEWLEGWGSKYIEVDIQDSKKKALLLAGSSFDKATGIKTLDSVLKKARLAAEKHLKGGSWPRLYFGLQGETGPQIKRYLNDVKKGRIALTYWADEDYDTPVVLGAQSWEYSESGHSQTGINELDAIIGKGHRFQTVKPLKLFKKIIHLWCPPQGLILDPYAGSGTTGHSVLELNKEVENTNRRFILIEQGQPDKGDKYARSLTQERIRRAITGERPGASGNLVQSAEPLGGGFEFRMLTKQIDAKTVLSMRKDELIDVVITSHWEANRRGTGLIRIEETGYKYLVGKDYKNEGYFIIWNGGDAVQQLDAESYLVVVQEANKAGLKSPYHVYARYEDYQSKSVDFNKIPDKILAHLGLNANSDRFNENEEGDEQ
jgi:adenine-specific DNA-methyltransferase